MTNGSMLGSHLLELNHAPPSSHPCLLAETVHQGCACVLQWRHPPAALPGDPGASLRREQGTAVLWWVQVLRAHPANQVQTSHHITSDLNPQPLTLNSQPSTTPWLTCSGFLAGKDCLARPAHRGSVHPHPPQPSAGLVLIAPHLLSVLDTVSASILPRHSTWGRASRPVVQG